MAIDSPDPRFSATLMNDPAPPEEHLTVGTI
jgi:hypothetical protein